MKRETYDVIYLGLITALLAIVTMLATQAKADTIVRSEIEKQISQSAIYNGVDPALALAIAEVESKFNPNAVGRLGEIGLFQLRPEYHAVVKGDTKHNIDVATKYLASLQRQCADYGDAYFVCFNYGPARKLKYPRLFPYYVKVKAVIDQRRQALQIVSNE